MPPKKLTCVGLYFTGRKSRNEVNSTIPWSQLPPRAKTTFKNLTSEEKKRLFVVIGKADRYLGEWTLTECSAGAHKSHVECVGKVVHKTEAKKDSKKGSKKGSNKGLKSTTSPLQQDIIIMNRMMKSLNTIEANIKKLHLYNFRNDLTTTSRLLILQVHDLIREYVDKNDIRCKKTRQSDDSIHHHREDKTTNSDGIVQNTVQHNDLIREYKTTNRDGIVQNTVQHNDTVPYQSFPIVLSSSDDESDDESDSESESDNCYVSDSD